MTLSVFIVAAHVAVVAVATDRCDAADDLHGMIQMRSASISLDESKLEAEKAGAADQDSDNAHLATMQQRIATAEGAWERASEKVAELGAQIATKQEGVNEILEEVAAAEKAEKVALNQASVLQGKIQDAKNREESMALKVATVTGKAGDAIEALKSVEQEKREVKQQFYVAKAKAKELRHIKQRTRDALKLAGKDLSDEELDALEAEAASFEAQDDEKVTDDVDTVGNPESLAEDLEKAAKKLKEENEHAVSLAEKVADASSAAQTASQRVDELNAKLSEILKQLEDIKSDAARAREEAEKATAALDILSEQQAHELQNVKEAEEELQTVETAAMMEANKVIAVAKAEEKKEKFKAVAEKAKAAKEKAAAKKKAKAEAAAEKAKEKASAEAAEREQKAESRRIHQEAAAKKAMEEERAKIRDEAEKAIEKAKANAAAREKKAEHRKIQQKANAQKAREEEHAAAEKAKAEAAAEKTKAAKAEAVAEKTRAAKAEAVAEKTKAVTKTAKNAKDSEKSPAQEKHMSSNGPLQKAKPEKEERAKADAPVQEDKVLKEDKSFGFRTTFGIGALVPLAFLL